MSISGIRAALAFLGAERRRPQVAAEDYDGLLAPAGAAGYRFTVAELQEAFRIQMRARLLAMTGGGR
ncbi:MAG: hypothetical protein CMO30_01145 [Tistrella sp.]|jgi:hypothetical protein|uniref:Uncharacterized protein n=1 Tax=Tistrella mobilis TaxID=171437 RepID=A0A3B9IJW9_9PROT|nr:hypothetical protein [Tistrella sp.]MAD38309.1 hypothetical protein [Tistrella sp.]MBA73886.1 hypothetical protein [Tistrella sp.]HAE48162.1 hypothetical protein [Tistrella mobilis]|tara:strand:+ start:290 stop:490 length:201 start_codon:yes stop_codon:yes gene_type:complete